MKTQWSDRKRKIVAFIAVNLGMLGGFILAMFLVPRETRLSTFAWICGAFFVLGNAGLGLKLSKPITRNKNLTGNEFDDYRAQQYCTDLAISLEIAE
jgi:hypothetical protein